MQRAQDDKTNEGVRENMVSECTRFPLKYLILISNGSPMDFVAAPRAQRRIRLGRTHRLRPEVVPLFEGECSPPRYEIPLDKTVICMIFIAYR